MKLTYFEILGIDLKEYEKVYKNFDDKTIVEKYIKMLDERLMYFLNMIMISKNITNNVEVLMKQYINAYIILKSKPKSTDYYNSLDDKTKTYINENYRLFNNSINTFNILKKHIGKNVTVTFTDSMGSYEMSEKLVEVTNFETIVISSIRYPFITNKRAIKMIVDNDTNEIIYINNNIDEEYIINNPFDLFKVKAMTWGRSMANRDASIDKAREDYFNNQTILRDIKKELKDNYSKDKKNEFEEYIEEDVLNAYSYYEVIKYLELLKKDLKNDKEIAKEIKAMQIPASMKNNVYKLTKRFN